MTQDIRLCLDFGTSYSKAWATKGPMGDDIRISIGAAAGQLAAEHPWTVASEIWRADDQLYWGNEGARRRHAAQAPEAPPLKEYITDPKKVRNLAKVSKRTGLSGEETLALWLAYMLRLCERDLDAKQGGQISHCVAMPCLGGRHEKSARLALVEALKAAAEINRNYRGPWNGISVKKARRVARQAMNDGRRAVDPGRKPSQDPEVVREPVVAGGRVFEDVVNEMNARFSNSPELVRRLYLVMDAGAGTTDFTLMQTFDRSGDVRLGVIAGAQTGVRIGGRKLRAGVEEVVRAHEMAAGTTDAELEEEAERTMRRIWQANNKDAQDAMTRRRVEATAQHRKAVRKLCQAVTECLTSALSQDDVQDYAKSYNDRGDKWPIFAIATGGAAEFDVVRQLVRGQISIEGAVFEFKPLEDTGMWRWVGTARRAQRSIERRQLAVARGGSMPELPQEIGDLGAIVMP